MSISVQQVAPGDVVVLWPVVSPLLQRAYDADPEGCSDTSLDQLKALLVSGLQRLLVGVENGEVICAATISPVYLPNASVAFITCAGGRGATDKQVQEQFRALCVRSGFTKIQWQGRPAMARMARRCGYREFARLVDFDLRGN